MPSLFRKMDTRRLHNSDMKELVRVLRNDPRSPKNYDGSQSDKVTELAIKKLPRRLRSSPLSSHRTLCRTHKGLDAHLIEDVWSWIKHELEIGIGRFLYPIIMSKRLSEEYEYRVRQLEPVVEMFMPGWTLAESPPPGMPPIDTGMKWAYQSNGCPACMLARIGSDEGTLFALFAGMYGHLRSRSGGQRDVKKIRSRRLRFVRYWMYTHANGDQAAEDAYDLGAVLKGLRREAKASLRRSGQSERFTRDSLKEMPIAAHHCLDDELEAGFDISEPYNPKDWGSATAHDPKIGPIPPFNPASPVIIEGWTSNHLPDLTRTNTHAQPAVRQSLETAHCMQSPHILEQDLLAPLPVFSNASLKRRDSVLSISELVIPCPRPPSSVYSSSRLTLATSIASFNNPTAARRDRAQRYDPLETQEERVNKYRKLIARTPFDYETDEKPDAVKFQGRLLPKPSRGSMYSAFGQEGGGGEEFDIVDVTPPPSPGLEGVCEEGEDDDGDSGQHA